MDNDVKIPAQPTEEIMRAMINEIYWNTETSRDVANRIYDAIVKVANGN